MTRDRLDSVLALDFLERHAGLVCKPRLRVMDIAVRASAFPPDEAKRDFRPVIEAAGCQLVAQEPLVMDPDVRRLAAIKNEYDLVRRV